MDTGRSMDLGYALLPSWREESECRSAASFAPLAASIVCCLVGAALRRLQALETRSQLGDLPAQPGDLPALLDQLGGEAAQREAESLGANLGLGPPQVGLVPASHGRLRPLARLWLRPTRSTRPAARAAGAS
jgi:hypothetical protein